MRNFDFDRRFFKPFFNPRLILLLLSLNLRSNRNVAKLLKRKTDDKSFNYLKLCRFLFESSLKPPPKKTMPNPFFDNKNFTTTLTKKTFVKKLIIIQIGSQP